MIIRSDLEIFTKIQTEAGQSLTDIIQRKEEERKANNGLFLWGVGNSLIPTFRSLDVSDDYIAVTFLKMLSQPAAHDKLPSEIWTWNSAFDCYGTEIEIPKHTVITSRGYHRKRSHYALYCYSTKPLKLTSVGPYDLKKCRNFLSGNIIGNSQVTFATTPVESLIIQNGRYKIGFQATLTPPYFVRLADPMKPNR